MTKTELDRYGRVAQRAEALIADLPSLDDSHPLPTAPWFEPGARWSARPFSCTSWPRPPSTRDMPMSSAKPSTAPRPWDDAGIQITETAEHAYVVDLGGTRHEVVVPGPLLTTLGLNTTDEPRLVRASFEFLLEREPATSILRRFDLDVIGRYFPEYLKVVAERLAGEPS